MKTLSRRNILVILLSFIFALSMVAFAGTFTPTQADGAVIAVSKADFKIEEEASVRIGTGKNLEVKGSGIRFRASVSEKLKTALEEDTTDKAYIGFIITPKYYFDQYVATGGDNYHDIARYVGKGNGGIIVDETKSFYPEDGVWYVNGALNDIKQGNTNIQFTAIAYVNDGERIRYSVPNADFARKYTEVVEKAFIDGHNPELLRSAAHVTETVDKMVSGDYTVSITNSKDLYNLSEAVADGKTFANAKFEIVNELAVDYDFTAIDGTNFLGSIKGAVGSKVTVYNNKAIDSILMGKNVETGDPEPVEIQGLTFVNEKNLFDITDKSGDLLYYEAKSVRYNATKMSAESVTKAEDAFNFTNFSGDVFSIPEYKSHGATPYAFLNYTAEEISAYKVERDKELADADKELAIKLTFLAPYLISNNTKTYHDSLFSVAGYGAGTTSGSHTIDYGRWVTKIISVEDFNKSFIKDNKVVLLQNWNDFKLYIGAIEFVEHNFNHDHEGGLANCTYKASCEICDQEYGDKGTDHAGGITTCAAKAICQYCDKEYGELLPHAEFISLEGKNPTAKETGLLDEISCSVCEQVVQEQKVLPAINFMPVEADVDNFHHYSGNPVKYNYFAEGSLPIATSYNLERFISNEVGYDGSALRVNTSSSGKGMRFKMPYTGAEYRKYAEDGAKYNAVKVWIAVSSPMGTFGGQEGTMLSFFDGTAVRQQWQCVVLDLNDFIGTFGVMEYADSATNAQIFTPDENSNIMIYRTEIWTGNNPWEVLVGSMEFIKYEEHEHVGGTATCGFMPRCTTCDLPYGSATNEHVSDDVATCTVRKQCDNCGQGFGELIPHEGGVATCLKLAECEVCAREYGKLADHTGGVATCIDLANCEVCGEEYGDFAKHTGGIAKCNALAECEVCGVAYGEMLPHAGYEVDKINPTAVNPGVAAGTRCSNCDVVMSGCEVLPALNYAPTQAGLKDIKISSSKIDKDYFANADLPTETVWYTSSTTEVDPETGEPLQIRNSYPILNLSNYTGDAIRLSTSNNARGIGLMMPYTGAEYREYAQANSYNAVKVWYAFTGASNNPKYTMLTVLNSSTNNNRWVPVVLTIDQFVGTFGSRSSTSFIQDENSNEMIWRPDNNTYNDMWEVFIGDMEFINWTDEDVLYKGEYGFTPTNEQDAHRAFIDRSGATSTLINASDLTVVPGTSTALTNNIGYSGKAIQVCYKKNADPLIYLNYNRVEYAKLAAKNNWTGVKFTYCMSKSMSLSTKTTVGVLEQNGSIGTTKQWNEITLTMDQFYACFSNDITTKLVFKAAAYNSGAIYFWIGNVEFISAN